MSIKLDAIAQRIHAATQRAVQEEAELILAEAVKIVPIEEGTLQDSGRVAVDDTTAAIGFGSGPAAPYAVRQHEELAFTHDSGRQAKYLEVPFMAARADAAQHIAQAVRDAL